MLLRQLLTFCHSSFVSATPLSTPDGLLPLLPVLYIYIGARWNSHTWAPSWNPHSMPLLGPGSPQRVKLSCQSGGGISLTWFFQASRLCPSFLLECSLTFSALGSDALASPTPLPWASLSGLERCVANITQGDFEASHVLAWAFEWAFSSLIHTILNGSTRWLDFIIS